MQQTLFPRLLPASMAGFALCGVALAQPTPDGIGFQGAATPIAEEVHFFHNIILMPIITVVTLFVLALLIWVVLRYNSKANPVARQFSHNTLVEVLWTGIPILILLFISLFSFDLLFKADVIPDGKARTYAAKGTDYVFANDFNDGRQIRRKGHIEVYKIDSANMMGRLSSDQYTLAGLGDSHVTVSLAQAPVTGERIRIVGGRSRAGVEPFLGLFGEDRSEIILAPTITIKAIGRQWGWDYQYPDFGDFEINANLKAKDQLAEGELWLLQADNNIIVPTGEVVRMIVTATDVLHSWSMPAFAVKIDAVPGRLNETWFKAPKPGMYYGQCSEICGKDHAYMPISLQVVTRAEFEAFVDAERLTAGLEPMFTPDETERLAAAK
ncbi:MAG: cytochrome c oxidase subunit II [Parvularculaceae bacterium]